MKTDIFAMKIEPGTLIALKALSASTTSELVRGILRKHFVDLLENDADYPVIVATGSSSDDVIQLYLSYTKARMGTGGFSLRSIVSCDKKKHFAVVVQGAA